MDWLLNYWYSPHRKTSLNLAIARWFVCLLAAWKVVAYPFGGIAEYPTFIVASGSPGFFQHWPADVQWIRREQYFAGICLTACAFGLAPGLTAFFAAAVITHLTALVWPVCLEKTWLPTVYFLLLYGLYRHEDKYVLWPVPKSVTVTDAHDAQKQGLSGQYAPLHSLKWFLMTIALIYFFTGAHKLGDGGWQVEWAAPTNMSRMLEERSFCQGNQLPSLAAWVMDKPVLLRALGFGTVALELGLLIAVLMNRLLTPCFLGLAAMHLSIWAMMRVNYVSDFVVMYLVFVPWDDLFRAAMQSRFIKAATQIARRLIVGDSVLLPPNLESPLAKVGLPFPPEDSTP